MSDRAATNDLAIRLARATWLLAVIVKWMKEQPDGTAHVNLSVGLVGCIRDFLIDQERGSGPE